VTVNDYTRDQDFSGATIVLDRFGEPESPFKVLEGNAHGHSYVDIAMIEALRKRT